MRSGPALAWGDLDAVFDPATGETHFPAELPALLLREIDSKAVNFPTLVKRLAGPVELRESACAQILSALLHLEHAELVESCESKKDILI